MKRAPLALLVVLPALAAAALAEEPRRQDAGTIDKLEVTSLTRQQVAIWARGWLPKIAEGSKQTFEGEVAVADVAIPVKTPVSVLVQNKGTGGDAVFFLDLTLDQVPEALLQKASSHAVDLTLKGVLKGDKGTSVPVCAVGLLRIGTSDIYAPAANVATFARFGSARLTGMSLTETTGEARAVLFNPFGFNVPVKDVAFSLYVGEHKLGEGKKQGLLIKAGRENEVAIPVTASNAELLAAAGSALRSGGTIDGRIVGSVTLKVGRGDVTIPLDLPGTIRVGP